MRIGLAREERSRKHWHIGVHVYDDEKLDHARVLQIVDLALRKHFPKSEKLLTPKAKDARRDHKGMVR